MSTVDSMTDEQFERHALDLLSREYGLSGLARFLRLSRAGNGDYTKDRIEWQKDLTVDEILNSMKLRRQG